MRAAAPLPGMLPFFPRAYQQLGGRISVLIKDGAAHHPHSPRDPKPIGDFIEASLKPAVTEPPAFVGKAFLPWAANGIPSHKATTREKKAKGVLAEGH
jgi:hypothetical protein